MQLLVTEIKGGRVGKNGGKEKISVVQGPEELK